MPYPNYILDPNATGGEDFVSIVAAEAAMQGDFDNTQPVTLSCRAGTETLTDTTYFAGWVTPTGGNTVTIQNAAGAEHGGVYGGPSYIMHLTTGFDIMLVIEVALFRIDGIQGLTTNTSANTVIYADAVRDTEVRNYLHKHTSDSVRSSAYFTYSASYVGNCGLWCSDDGGGMQGPRVRDAGTLVENCTFYVGNGNGLRGIYRSVGSPTVKNTACLNYFIGIDNGLSAATTNNASTDDTAGNYTNGQINVSLAAGVDLVDVSTGDFNPVALGKLDSNGVDIPGTSPDVAGNTRTSPWEIGAWEIAGAGPTPAVLTLPTVTPADTSALIGCTTDTAGGTLYWYVSTSATAPSSADLKAGTGAVSFGNLVPSLGANTDTATGLTASTQYWHYWIQETI